MDLIPFSICNKSLDFQPDAPWPKNWPAFAWNQFIVAGFKEKNFHALNFSSEDVKFLHLFHTCHPRLHLSEFSRITSLWKKTESFSFSWKDFFSKYDLKNTRLFTSILPIFANTPLVFQKWVDQKKIHPSELRVLTSLKDIKSISSLLQWISEENLSHSLGISILEQGVELILMGTSLEEIFKNNLSQEEVLKTIEQKRKPLSHSEEQIKKEQLKKILWPSGIHSQWQRKGDKTGLEIKIWCQNQKELEEKLSKVNQLSIFQQLKK